MGRKLIIAVIFENKVKTVLEEDSRNKTRNLSKNAKRI